MYPFFGVFDYGDPSVHIEERSSTTVATLALFLMNAPVTIESAGALAALTARAEATAAPADADKERVQRMYQLALGRSASAEEVREAVDYVRSTS
jgi:hypothetical protein